MEKRREGSGDETVRGAEERMREVPDGADRASATDKAEKAEKAAVGACSGASGGVARIAAALAGFRARRDGLPKPTATLLRAVLLAFAAVVGCLLVEWGWRDDLAAFDGVFFALNVLLCGVVLAVFYLIGQRTRLSIVLFLALCLVIGAAFHFVMLFKGQVILPSDVMAAGTALAVSRGYTYAIDGQLGRCLVLFALSVLLVALGFPRTRSTGRQRLVSAGAGALVAAVLAVGFFSTQIDESLGFEVDNWAPQLSYEENGTLLSFLALAQDARVPVPTDYTTRLARETLAAFPDQRTAAMADLAALGERNSWRPPTVIAIMNESFADLATMPGFEGSALEPARCRAIMEDALVAGHALASVFAGGTCNSEFEFLSGTSMAFQSNGYYPYLCQDFSASQTLPAYFRSLGYRTCAIHPNWPANWRREQVYPAMGFDEFVSIEAFENAALVRGEVRDSASYNGVLSQMGDGKEPQFIFCVTMANHGGYDREVEPGLVADGDAVPAAAGYEGKVFADLIQLADADLARFVEALQGRDEPVVLCFFGDHQPSVSEQIFEAAFGTSMDAARAADNLGLMERAYEVPYFIWENDAQKDQRAAMEATLGLDAGVAETDSQVEARSVLNADDADGTPSSLCFLQAQLVQAAGLPQTSFMLLTNAVRAQYPLFNALGYYHDGAWHHFSPADDKPVLLHEYAVASYGVLYDDALGRSSSEP